MIVAPGPYDAPGATRTPGQRFRKPLLYPSELRGQSSENYPSGARKVNVETTPDAWRQAANACEYQSP